MLGLHTRRFRNAAIGLIAGLSMSVAGTAVATTSASAAAVPAAAARPAATPKLSLSTSDWPGYLRGAAHTSGAFDVAGFTQALATSLPTLWKWNAPNQSSVQATPTVAAGRVFLGTIKGGFYALDANTGKVLWSKALDKLTCCGNPSVTSTATVAPDPVSQLLTVYVAGGRYLYAFDAATGQQRWKVLVGGKDTPNQQYRNWSSPTVVGGHVLMGIGAAGDTHEVRGGVAEFNQHSGALQHTYYTVPAGKVGAPVWSSVASDGTYVWVTTGNPIATATTLDDSYSIVRLSLATLKKIDKWTAPISITADYDFGSSPTLFKATLGGTATQMVGACNKNGIFYAWRATNLAAGPVWQRQVGNPSSEPDMCINSAAWDFSRQVLYVAANSSTVGAAHTPVGSSVRAINPATGAYLWETGLSAPGNNACFPVGSPSLNGNTGILAIPGWCNDGSGVVYLVDSLTGTKISTWKAGQPVYSQPIFAGSRLYVVSGLFSNAQLVAIG